MELTAKLIISYINSARFPDVEDVYKFNHIKFYLSAEMDEEIKSQFLLKYLNKCRKDQTNKLAQK